MNIYVFPFGIQNNTYIERCKLVWGMLGWKVHPNPLSVKAFIDINKKTDDILILNWFEDSPSYCRRPFVRFLSCTLYLMIARIFFTKIIWVKHNFEPHNKGVRFKLYFKCLSWLLNKISDNKVAHRNIEDDSYNYIPHPTYEDSVSFPGINERVVDFLVFGSIQKYKGIQELLLAWPQNKKLKIVGICRDKNYEEDILNTIVKRKLQVDWDNAFISNSALNDLIASAKVVIIPHNDDGMIVSGAFYHAASLGCGVLAIESGFANWIKSKFSFVSTFNYQDVSTVIDDYVSTSPQTIKNAINEECGLSRSAKEWNKLIQKQQ